MADADTPRLIEYAFPLKQASLDSVHEKNVRHGHISTLHIWPARRPLAACRAALIATLLPDPSAEPKPEGMGDDEWQKEIQRRRRIRRKAPARRRHQTTIFGCPARGSIPTPTTLGSRAIGRKFKPTGCGRQIIMSGRRTVMSSWPATGIIRWLGAASYSRRLTSGPRSTNNRILLIRLMWPSTPDC